MPRIFQRSSSQSGFNAVKAALGQLGYTFEPNGLPDKVGVPQGAFYKLLPGEDPESDEANVFYLTFASRDDETPPTSMEDPVVFSAQNFANQLYSMQMGFDTLNDFIAKHTDAEKQCGDQLLQARLRRTRGLKKEARLRPVGRGIRAHPGLIKLTTFDTPPDGDKLTVQDVMAANPSPEVLRAAAGLTTDELEHLFIDSVGSFEVTHPNYRRPAKAPEVLVDFFRKLANVPPDEELSPELQAFLAREKARSESVETQAAKLVEFAKQKASKPAEGSEAPFHIDVDVAPELPNGGGYDYKSALAWAKKVCTMSEFEGLLDYAAEGANGYVQVKGQLPNIELVNKFAELYGSGYATEPSDQGGTQIYFE